MLRWWGALIGLSVLVAACAAPPGAGDEPRREAPSEGAPARPGPSATAGDDTTGAPAATPGDDEAAAPTAQPGDGGPIVQVAPGGSIDMSAVTPDAGGGGGGPPVEQPRPGEPGPQGQIDRAVRDLAARTGADPAAITVREAEAVEWPDGSLGCPRPGFAYTQAIVPGYRIVLEAGGQPYTYHADGRTSVVLCVGGKPAS